jgi:cyclophilin family peptidyl-prolyl cis-trans isomerase
MANSGANTNGTQFFITLASCKHRDNKHSVFGEITTNEELLYKINREFASEKNDKPKIPITLENIYCFENPFRKVIKKLKEQYEEGKKNQ